jgi:hypothetical protein
MGETPVRQELFCGRDAGAIFFPHKKFALVVIALRMPHTVQFFQGAL